MRMGERRMTTVLGVVVGLALLAGLATLGVSTFLTRPGVPLDPYLPNEQALIDLGLSSTPGPDQPQGPVAVDRVLVDKAATYVQFHLTVPAVPRHDLGYPSLDISDDQGTLLSSDPVPEGGSFYPVPRPGWTLPFPLPSWVPSWVPRQPQTFYRGDVILGALPTTVRVATLKFSRFGTVETVRVPLDLRALAHQRVAHPNMQARAAGLTLTLRDLDFTHLTYTYTPQGGGGVDAQGVWLTDGHGSHVSLIRLGTGRCTYDTGGTTCRDTWAFSPQRPGTHLMLTIPTIEFSGGRKNGPWRFSSIVP